VHQSGQRRLGRRRINRQGELAEHLILPDKSAAFPYQAYAAGADVVNLNPDRRLLADVMGNQRVHAASSPAADDAAQPAGGFFVEAGREVGHHQEAIRLGELARLAVICIDRFEFITEVLLNHVLHVVRQVGQPLFNMGGFRPDARVNQRLLVVRQVHESGEIAAQPNGINDGESHTAGRQGSQQPGHDRLQDGDGLVAAVLVGLNQQRGIVRQSEHRRHAQVAGVVRGEVAQLQNIFRQPLHLDLDLPETNDRTETARRPPLLPGRVAPIHQCARVEIGCSAQECSNVVQARPTAGFEFSPGTVVGGLAGTHLTLVATANRRRRAFQALFEPLDDRLPFLVGLLSIGGVTFFDFSLQPGVSLAGLLRR